MKRRWTRFFSILLILLAYTAFKIGRVWPSHLLSAILGTALIFALMLASQIIHRTRDNLYGRFWCDLLVWVGSVAIGVWATFILLVFPLDILHLFAVALSSLLHLPMTHEVLFRNASMTFIALAIALPTIGFFQALKGPIIKRTTIPIDQLPGAFSQLKLVQISDLHVGPTIRRKYVENVVSQINELAPDLVFLTGDLMDGRPAVLMNDINPLSRIKAKYGRYYVTGNHEYYWGAEDIVATVKELGFVPLLNENKIVEINGNKIMVCGVTDSSAGYFLAEHKQDLEKAARSSDRVSLKILLSHRPHVASDAAKLGFDLQFSGHTHSGQFFPFTLIVRLAERYYRGLHQLGRLWLYVSAGTGYWGPANRFAVRPEIAYISLAPKIRSSIAQWS